MCVSGCDSGFFQFGYWVMPFIGWGNDDDDDYMVVVEKLHIETNQTRNWL